MKNYKMYIHPKDLKTLKKDIWSDDAVLGTLKENTQKYLIEVSYRGHSIRKHAKKSFDITFKKPFLVEQAHLIHLNGEFKDPSLIRSRLSLNFFKTLGVTTPLANHVLLNLNGKFMGIYLEIESFDEYFLKKRGLPDGYIYYATNNDANFSLLTETEAKTNILQGYSEKYDVDDNGRKLLTDLLFKINTLTNLEFEQEIPKILDIEKYLTWLTGVVCLQNFDGFIHNYALYWNSETRLFEISPWDCDGTWGRNRHGEILDHDYIPIEGYNTLTARLLHISAIRSLYKKTMINCLTNYFTKEQQSPIIYAFLNELKLWVEKDPFMHGRESIFHSEPEFILEYIKKRNEYLSSQIKNLT